MAEDGESKVLDTVIVGAGLAGLTTAYRLRDKEILVLEKEEVIGGRTISRTLGPYVYNAGAQVILGDKSIVAQLADELGVKRTLIKKTKIPIHMKGKLIASSTEVGFLWQLPLPLWEKIKLGLKILTLKRRFTSIVDKIPPDPKNPKIIELTSKTLQELVGATHPDVKAIWDTLAMGMTSEEVAAFHPVNTFLHFRSDEYYVEGGTHELTKALHNHVSDKVETSADVQEIAQQDGMVQVTYEKEGQRKSVQARHCVVSAPAPLVPSMVKDLPEWKRDVLSNFRFGAMTSAAFLLSEPSENFLGEGVWRVPVVGKSAFAYVSDPTFTFPKEVKERTGQGLLRVYTGDKAAQRLMAMSDGEALEALAEDLLSVFPRIEGKIITSSIEHWKYANSPWSPGQLEKMPSVAAPTGNIHYCGDYTISGSMIAAVRSAYRVVEELKTT